MNELGIKSRVRAKKFRSYRGEVGESAPNLLNRNFTAEEPNEKWVTDVTEFRVAGKKLYLSPIMDLYNREIIAYELSRRSDFSLVMSMFKKAVRKCPNEAKPLLHSHQGWHYRMQPYQEELARCGIIQSMSRKGYCYDNAAMESFFGKLISECSHLTKFEDVDALQDSLKGYIDYYNRQRIKSKLVGLSPVEYLIRAAKN